MDLPDRKGIVALIAAASVLSLTALYLYSLTIGPTAVPIGDLHDGMVGQWVETVGQVKEARLSSSGLLLRLMDPLDYSEVAAFVPMKTYEGIQEREDILPGAEVVVRGEVQLYRGELEIVIASPGDLTIVRKAGP